MNIFKRIKYYFLEILSILKAKPLMGGLEISDTALRFGMWHGRSLQTAMVRLEPGIILGGRIKDEEGFLKAIGILRNQILGKKRWVKNKKINLILSISGISLYTQIFYLPIVEEESLERAIGLNVKMVSPTESKDTYSGWQVVHWDEDEGRVEVLSAFIEKDLIDNLLSSLREVKMPVIAVESAALSLARSIREAGNEIYKAKPYVVVFVNALGMGVHIVRHGQLHFDYFTPWSDLLNKESAITVDSLKKFVGRGLYQVFNFYNSHWKEPVSEVLVVSPALQDEIVSAVRENFHISARSITIISKNSLPPEWLVAAGASLRGLIPRDKDREISLMNIGAREEFRQEQIISFSEFWRTLVPVSLGVLMIAFVGSSMFLSKMRNDLAERASRGGKSSEIKEVRLLQEEAKDFNRLVGYIKITNDSREQKAPMLRKFNEIISIHGVLARSYTISGIGQTVSLSGFASNQEKIISFKRQMEKSIDFDNVSLPITDIQPTNQGYSFTISFSFRDDTAE